MQNQSGFGVNSGSLGIDGILVIFNVNTRLGFLFSSKIRGASFLCIFIEEIERFEIFG